MRLSTEQDRDEQRAIAVLHAALDAGVTFLNTSDAYAWNHEEIGHNERLIARALASWSNDDRSRVVVATKGGLTRPQGNWIPDGRARHLAMACEASCYALGVSKLQLYQLHAIDPRVPLATSVRALAALQRDGLVEAIGLCNVNVAQIEEARRIVEIATVQVEVNLWRDDSLLNGVVEYCTTHGIRLIVWCDDVLRAGRSGEAALAIMAARGETLRRHQRDGWHLCGLSWQPEIAEGSMTIEQADANFARMQEALGVTMDILYCPHGAGAPACWCRKPLPGLGVVLIAQHQLDPAQCLYVGNGPQDPGFARRLGFAYVEAAQFFPSQFFPS